jgi:hypothetical protein
MAAATKAVQQRRRPALATLETANAVAGVYAWVGGPLKAGARCILAYNCRWEKAPAPGLRVGWWRFCAVGGCVVCLCGAPAQGTRTLHPGLQLQVGVMRLRCCGLAVLCCSASVALGTGGAARSRQARAASRKTTADGLDAPATVLLCVSIVWRVWCPAWVGSAQAGACCILAYNCRWAWVLCVHPAYTVLFCLSARLPVAQGAPRI